MTDIVGGAVPLGVVARPATMRNGAIVDLRVVTPAECRRPGGLPRRPVGGEPRAALPRAGIDPRAAGRELAAPDGFGLIAFAGARAVGHGCLDLRVRLRRA